MSDGLKQTALMRFLAVRHDQYYGKVLELRSAINSWLGYIPQTFPHYTSHTVDHSEEIITQVSFLLFQDGDGAHNVPVVDLSPVEAYILCASAFLHDCGMVASDREKGQILASDEWSRWISDSEARRARLGQIEEFRHGSIPTDHNFRQFLADVQLRYLISEFVRRSHHHRSVRFLTEHRAELGRFDFGDPMLLRTIAQVCLAHGLSRTELEDAESYPDRAQVAGQNVNVRFMALMLRLGDLLDMRADRACPLLLNAACTLPADSLAHWTKYQRFTFRNTSPDRISLVAECTTHDEHRYLQDWCQWLVNEVREASVLMDRAARHRGWTPPQVSLDGASPTIVIRPSSDAKYTPARWIFELDPDVVFTRLIHDVYTSPLSFLRELLQNALDATRAQMYLDLRGLLETPEYPTDAPSEVRASYPISVKLTTVPVTNELSGETEERHLLTVEDCGIGMDADVIRRYFLQVGHSYYTSDEFRRSFRFVPTSRFGVGFLSVFAVSDLVEVETLKPSSKSTDGALRLVLTGPRNYLLTERSDRKRSGTRVGVLLRDRLESGAVLTAIRQWCRFVEFPIEVEENGKMEAVEAETPGEFTYEIPDVSAVGARFALRAFPTNIRGVGGHLYVLAHVDERGESWAERDWAKLTYPSTHPNAAAPPVPQSMLCFHGIALVLQRIF
jgi:hypothetical protein